jgi:hypothetical protein
MSVEEYQALADAAWKANRGNAAKIAEAVWARHRLPESATVLIPNLAALLGDLQHASFVHGATAAFFAVHNQDDPVSPAYDD